MRADNPATRRPAKLRQRFFHAPGNRTWLADSFHGINEAKRKGFKWIDTNHQVSKDGIAVCTHWGRPLLHGWYDPQGKIKRTARVRSLTWAELSRLRLRNGGKQVIRKSASIIAHAGQQGIGVEFEAKNAMWTSTIVADLLEVAEQNNTSVLMKTISNLGGTSAGKWRLTVFHRVGWRTVLLPRGTRRIPRSWWPVVDAVRGPVIWTGKPAGAKPPTAPKPTLPVMGDKAIATARNQSLHGPRIDKWLHQSTYLGWCLMAVRTCYGIPGGTPDAIAAWNNAKGKHRTANAADIPAGYPVFWSGGSAGHGHIAISAGGGKCWSTDIRRGGYFDLVDIDTIHRQWGLTLLGYTTDLNGKAIS